MDSLTLDKFDFFLPKELIAQEPQNPRGSSKLLEVNNGKLIPHSFNNVIDLLNENDLLIVNNTKVIKSRIIAKKNNSSFVLTLHKSYPTNDGKIKWLGFVNHSKKLNEGDTLDLANNVILTIIKKLTGGEILVEFNNLQSDLFSYLEKYGYIPLPPYIKRENINVEEDSINYQTIFANIEGAVAAPTASLHFTEEIYESIKSKKVKTCEVTLHVGAGTFLPVKTQNIKEHVMHKEYGEVSEEVISLIGETKQKGGRVIAVGTTVLRILEHLYSKGEPTQSFKGETDIFIYPGFEFKVIDALITNFHTPKSTLLMLVSAFAGVENIKKAYEYAVNNQYRFFSYGDSTFLHKENHNKEL